MDGLIARLRSAAHKPGQLWCCMTFPLVLCERFLNAAAELGVRFRQDFAPECLPILDGRIVRPIADIFSPTRAV